MRRFLSIFLLAAAASSACAFSLSKFTPNKGNDYGVVYTLPKTAVDIVIEAELTEQQPGEFSNYARRYLNLSDAIRQPSHSATVKSITIVPVAIPDTSARFSMQFKGQGITYVMLDEKNAPVAVNTEQTASVPSIQIPEARAAEPTPLETEAAKQAITREMSQSSSQSKRAELAAQRIFELREYRNDLISGQADNTPPDGKSLELSLNNITAQEAALTAMFAGTKKTQTVVGTVRFVPDTTDVKDLVIARISPTEGIVAADDLSGAPVYLNMTISETGKLPVDEKGLTMTMPKGGVAYRIPGRADISVWYDGREKASRELDVAQLGVVFGVDPKVFTNKKAPAFLIFNPLTGAVETLGTSQPETPTR